MINLIQIISCTVLTLTIPAGNDYMPMSGDVRSNSMVYEEMIHNPAPSADQGYNNYDYATGHVWETRYLSRVPVPSHALSQTRYYGNNTQVAADAQHSSLLRKVRFAAINNKSRNAGGYADERWIRVEKIFRY